MFSPLFSPLYCTAYIIIDQYSFCYDCSINVSELYNQIYFEKKLLYNVKGTRVSFY